MQENFRQFLDRLRQNGELVDLHQPVDIRHIATLVDQAKTALYFHNVIGYDMPVVSGIIRSRERAMMALGAETYREIEDKLSQAIAKPIPPKYVKTSPAREVTLVGDDVDLYKLPIPMSSIYDGGPMITAGVVIARDPELGFNSGIYRFMVKEKALTGIDLVTPNNMRLFVQRALERGEPLPISISIGTHPIEITGSGYRAPLGVDEMAIAGGIRGEPVALAPCQTIDVPYIADAEIVLEAEVLPTGWTYPEGRFGEFTRLMGGLHWNPQVRIKAISMRKDAIYYNLHMPWENTWLAAPTRYATIRAALRTAGVQVKDINVTLGGCAFWHAVISIKKQPGEGKNALLAALSVMDLKHVVVVDDDIDVNDPAEVEWAIATRVQGDRDVMIVSNARAKPLDPSLPQGYGVVPTGAKVGIDATIPENIPREYYERITYAYADRAKIDDYVGGKKDAAGEAGDEAAVAALGAEILQVIGKEPLYFTDIAEKFAQLRFRHHRPRHRPSARDRKALAGPARPAVRARLGVRRQAAAKIIRHRDSGGGDHWLAKRAPWWRGRRPPRSASVLNLLGHASPFFNGDEATSSAPPTTLASQLGGSPPPLSRAADCAHPQACRRSALFSASSCARRSRTGASAASISASVKRGVMCCGQFQSKASRWNLQHAFRLRLVAGRCHRRGELRIVGKVLDLDVRENFQPPAVRIIHQDQRGAAAGRNIADGDVLPVAAIIRDRQGLVVEHADEAGRPAAMLHIGPAAFRNGGHVEAVARGNERRLVFGEAVEAALAMEASPIIGAAVFPLRFLHARGRGDIEKAISHVWPLLRQPIGCANPQSPKYGPYCS